MPVDKKSSLFLGLFIILIILFDAFQQQYYLNTFDLMPAGQEFGFWTSFRVHFIRWAVWAMCAIPVCLYTWKSFSENQQNLNNQNWLSISAFTFFTILIATIAITFTNMMIEGYELTLATFSEIWTFIVVQKGLSFLFATCVLLLILFNQSKNLLIDAQWIEIKNLKSDTGSLVELEEPVLNIRIGNRLKLIALHEISWIEADDYCVKIHTGEKSYSLRKSLKSLEEDLAPYKFIRVHRKALMNMQYLDHIDFQESVIRLQDHSEIPLSKSGAQNLRAIVDAHSV